MGVAGLVRRLALDRALPAAFERPRWVVLGFFALTSSLFLALTGGGEDGGQLSDLGGVYALVRLGRWEGRCGVRGERRAPPPSTTPQAFLSVMVAFAAASLLLKAQRPALPRLAVTPVAVVAAALAMVLAGLVGNVLKSPGVVPVFLAYFAASLAVVGAMLERTRLLRLALRAVRCAVARGGGRRAAQLHAAHVRNEAAKLRGYRGGGSQGDPFARQQRQVAGWPLQSRAEEEAVSPSSAGGAGGASSTTVAVEPVADDAGSSSLDDYEDPPTNSCGAALLRAIEAQLLAAAAAAPPVVFFARDADLPTLVRAVRYVQANEQAGRLCVAHFVDEAPALASIEARFAGGEATVLRLAAELMAATAPPPPAANAAGSALPSREGTGPLRADVALQLLECSLPPLPAEAALLADHVSLVDAVCRPEVSRGGGCSRWCGGNALGWSAHVPRHCAQFAVDCLVVRGVPFGPAAVAWLARYLGAQPNFFFMGAYK